MFIKEMVISKLMTYDQQIEEEKLKESVRETKKTGINNYDYSHHRSDGSGNSQFRHRYSRPDQSSNTASWPKFNMDRVQKTKSPSSSASGSSFPSCQKCGKSHRGECLVGIGGYFSSR